MEPFHEFVVISWNFDKLTRGLTFEFEKTKLNLSKKTKIKERQFHTKLFFEYKMQLKLCQISTWKNQLKEVAEKISTNAPNIFLHKVNNRNTRKV